MCRSVPQIAVFSSLISTSLEPGLGTGTCSIQMPLPASRLTSAFIVCAMASSQGREWETAIIRGRPRRSRAADARRSVGAVAVHASDLAAAVEAEHQLGRAGLASAVAAGEEIGPAAVLAGAVRRSKRTQHALAAGADERRVALRAEIARALARRQLPRDAQLHGNRAEHGRAVVDRLAGHSD